MMPRTTLLAPALAALALAGCIPPANPPETAPPAEANQCGASKVMKHLNALPTEDVLAAIRSGSGAASIRVIHPGDAVTMDYRPDRLNVEIGADGRIKSLRCT